MDLVETSPQTWLQSEFRARKQKNASYSLRRMAQQLDLPSGRLSEILSGRRKLTRQLGEKICERLGYSPEKRQRFLATIDGQRAEDGDYREANFLQLSTDAFNVLADWHHYAILSLMELEDFDPAPLAIAARLGISSVEARSSLEAMKRLGLLKVDGGRLVKTTNNITTTRDISSAALRLSHKQNLELAAAALDDVAVELRDVTSMTMAVDIAKLPEAKAMIRRFRRKLSNFMESGKKNEVYNLTIQLIPLTKKRGKK